MLRMCCSLELPRPMSYLWIKVLLMCYLCAVGSSYPCVTNAVGSSYLYATYVLPMCYQCVTYVLQARSCPCVTNVP